MLSLILARLIWDSQKIMLIPLDSKLCKSVSHVVEYFEPTLSSVLEFIREYNEMELNDHKEMEKNGMKLNVFK